MNADELQDFVLEAAGKLGLNKMNDHKTIIDSKGNAIIRSNIKDGAYADGSAFFSIISPDEDTDGKFSDFSFTVFPEKELGACVVTLGVGSLGFKNDYQLASQPGLRRQYLKLHANDNSTFFKTSFEDIETTSSDLLKEIRSNYESLAKVIESYKTVLPAARIITFDNENTGDSEKDLLNELELYKEEYSPGITKGLNILLQWLATYADVREWGTATQKKLIKKILDTIPSQDSEDVIENVNELLKKRKYVVLQGAPGCGKTWTANEIAKKYFKKLNVRFTQFHAETSYSDFVYGLEPNLEANNGPQFKPKHGILSEIIKSAKAKEEEDFLLIIDEINRANLSNVLGPVFYLFEYQAGNRQVDFKIGDMTISEIPKNLYVIATMNTADKSLAVVDFALRRRFAWYTIRPQSITAQNGKIFMEDDFKGIKDIFDKYATDEELNLQPGPSYFLVDMDSNKKDRENAMKDRMIYELMPLIKEYLSEGFLSKAKDEFFNYFLKKTGKLMYE